MRRFALLLAASALCGCSSLLDVAPPSSTTGPNDPSKQMSASIDGVFWFAQVVSVSQSASTIKFTGVLNLGQASERSIILQFQTGATGTQTFGNEGGVYAQVGVGNSNLNTWATKAAGPTGTVTLTTATINHFVGTFSFDAQSNFIDTNPFVRKVTAGVFDITF